MRTIHASREMSKLAKISPDKKVRVYGFFPVDRAGCECRKTIEDWKAQLSRMSAKRRKAMTEEKKFLVCPRDKTGMKRFEVICKTCKEILGYCWATDKTLTDWCDFHYTQWTDGEAWHGCFTPHISPVTEQLCFECCCGEDTRDFRANMTLPAKAAHEIEERNKIGRDFGKAGSKFKTRIVSKNVVPF